MAKIDRIERRVVTADVSASPAAAAAAQASAAQTGAVVQQQSQAFFEEAKVANQNANFSKAYTAAVEEFQTRSQERQSQSVDADGNPNFEQLPGDVQQIGKEVMQSRIDSLNDPEVKARLQIAFGNYSSNQHIASLKTARNQAIDFSRAQVNQGIDQLEIQAAQDDPSLADSYIMDGKSILDEALKGGAITAQEHQQKFEAFRVGIESSYVEQQIDADPEGMLQAFREGNTFGLPSNKVKALERVAEAAVNDQARAMAREAAVATKNLDKEQKHNSSLLELDMVRGQGSEVAILRDFQEGKISQEQFDKLNIKLAKSNASATNKVEQDVEIRSAINNGDTLANFGAAEINRSFKEDLEVLGPNADLMEVTAKIAVNYKGRVTDYQRILTDNLGFGSTDDALDTVEAIKYLQQTNPRALDKMSAESMAIYGRIAQSQEIYKDSSKMNDAIARARDIVKAPEGTDTEFLKTSFKKESATNAKELKSYIQDAVSDEGFFDFTTADNVDPELMADSKLLLEEAYIANGGDVEAAKEAVKVQLKTISKETVFNGGDLIMKNPPELIYEGVPGDVLQDSLLGDIQAVRPGIENEDITVEYEPISESYLISAAGELLRTDDGIGFLQWRFDKPAYDAQDSSDRRALEAAKKEGLQAAKGVTDALETAGALGNLASTMVKSGIASDIEERQANPNKPTAADNLVRSLTGGSK